MRRREFIALLGGAALAWPFAARAQQPGKPVIGFLTAGSTTGFYKGPLTGLREGLKETGYVDGQNATIELHSAEGEYDRLPALAADLVHRQVAVIVAIGPPAALAAKAATDNIPVVFTSGTDPVKLGLVGSFNRPGRNLTGVHLFAAALGSKRLGLVRELVPTAAVIAFLANPNYSGTETEVADVLAAARTVGQQVHILNASSAPEIDAAFDRLAELRVGALMVGADLFFNSRRDQLVTLAARHRAPAMYNWREFPAAGGLMSYGISLADAYHQVGVYTGRILNGAKPADLPVQQPTKFELVINLKTAKALGLTVPPSLLAFADEVIE